MRALSRSAAVAAVVLPLVLAVTGCGSDAKDNRGADATKATTSKSADPKQALENSLAELGNGNFRFTRKDVDSTASGLIHKASQSAELSLETKDAEIDATITAKYLMIGDDAWVKFSFSKPELTAALGIPADKWLHVQLSKIKSDDDGDLKIDFSNPESIDPGDSHPIMKSIVTAEHAGDGKYTGTVDLSKLSEGDMIATETITALADQAKNLPFTATLDGDGQLTMLSVQVPAAGDVPAHTVEMSYADYGKITAPQRPAPGEFIEASEAQYELFGG